MTDRHEPLARWAQYADVAAIILLAVGAHVIVAGGFVVRFLGLRISLRSEWRTLLWAVAILIIRHLIVRRPSLPEQAVTSMRNMARATVRLPLDLELLGQNRPRPSGGRRRMVGAIAVTVLFAGLTAIMTFPQVRYLGTGVTVDVGDPLLSTWKISWIAHQITRDPLHLFDANIFHPARYTLAFSDAVLVPALTVAPLLWLGVPQLVAYNLLLLSGFALSGLGMFVLVRSLTGQVGAALVAGFVFAFLPFRFMHYAHLELQMAQWMPLCLWAFHRTVEKGRLRDGLLTGLFFALQTLSSLYYGIFFATFFVPLAGVLLIAAGRERMLRSVRPLAAGALLASVLIAPIGIPYLAARQTVGQRPLSEIAFYSATPQNYLAAHPRNALLGQRTAQLGQQERELFQGVVVPLIALAAFWPPLSAARIGYGLALALAFDASLGFNGISYAWLHTFVLPYKGLRVPARMAMLVGLALSVLVGYGVARLTARRTTWVAAGLTLAIAVLVFVEDRSTLQLGQVWTSPPPIYERLRNEPSSVLLELPLKTPDIYLEPVYMYFSTFHWHKLVNGYSGFSPPSYSYLLGLMATFPDETSIAELRRRDVDFVVVHGALFVRPDDDYEKTISDLNRNPNFELVADDEWQGKDTRLYRLLPSDSRLLRSDGTSSLRRAVVASAPDARSADHEVARAR